ncbi:MAG TPA: hypothetical protein VG452_00620 [Egibacteraceae bacterium]|nr:hypothetical protein [Egibacteraceae bacterium]
MAGFEDFAGEGRRGIEAGRPARSLLYRAVAAPGVVEDGHANPSTVFPTPADVEAVESLGRGSGSPHGSHRHGGTVMKPDCELSTRSSIRAFYAREHLLIVAEGELPSPGYLVDIEQSLIEIFPPQFSLLRCRRPGVFPAVITPFRHSESFRIGETRPEQVTVHHAEGSDEVVVEDCGAELGAYAQAVGEGPTQKVFEMGLSGREGLPRAPSG